MTGKQRAAGVIAFAAAAACGTGQAEGPGEPVPAERVVTGVAAPVEGQLVAYNAHDLEAFLAFYTEDVRLYDLSAETPAPRSGKEAMRAGYTFLTTAPDGFRADVVTRTVMGKYVTDHERVHIPGRPTVEAVVTYEVTDGLISRVWFFPEP